LVELVDEVVSTEETVDVGVWDNGVNNITTEDDLAEDGEEIDLSVDNSLVDFVGDQVFTEELLEEENILLGDSNGLVNNDKTADDEVDEFSRESLADENLTEDGEEIDLSEDDSFENILGDDLVADELLEEDGLTLGQDNGVNDWVDGVNDVTADDHLTEDGEEVDLSDEDGLVDFGGDQLLAEEILEEEDILLSGDWNNGVDGNKTGDDELDEVGGDTLTFKNLTEEGGELDLSQNNTLVDFLVDDLLTEEILEDDKVLFGQDDVVNGEWNNGVDDWDNLLVNLNIDDLGVVDESLFLSWENLDISLDFSEISGDDWLVDVQVLVELVQKELVVGGFGLEWKSGWESKTVVGVWENILVLQKDVIDQGLESKDILFLSVGSSGDGVLSVEKLDNGVNVLVEEDGVEEVLLVGWDGPELLEVDGLNKTLEGWVLDVLAEQGNLKIFLEQLGGVQLFDGEDTVPNNGVVVDSSNSLVNWENGGVNQVLLLTYKLLLVNELLLQQ
jgi:hypothetical protein